MIALPLPKIDAALVVALLLAFFVTLALALAVRPELRDGRKLSRMVSYATGSAILLGAILLLAGYRGIACQCWAVQVPQLWLDATVLAGACAAATILHRVVWGEPRRGNPHRELRALEKQAEELTRNATDLNR